MFPADDEMTSLSATGPAYAGAIAFTTTHWSVLLERRDLRTVRKEKGRLRSYLLTALKHFLADEHRRATAIKRGKGERLIPLEQLRTEEQSGMEPADPLTAERIYERRWASTLLDRVLSRLEDTYRKRGNAALFDSFNQLLADEPGTPSQADIAAQLGMTENAVSQAYHRFRQSYQSLLREEIANTVATPGDIENELRYLIAVIRASGLTEFYAVQDENSRRVSGNDQSMQNLPQMRREDLF